MQVRRPIVSKISSNFTFHLMKVGNVKQVKKVSSDFKTILMTDLGDLHFLGLSVKLFAACSCCVSEFLNNLGVHLKESMAGKTSRLFLWQNCDNQAWTGYVIYYWCSCSSIDWWSHNYMWIKRIFSHLRGWTFWSRKKKSPPNRVLLILYLLLCYVIVSMMYYLLLKES